MTTSHRAEAAIAEQISTIREFNRFYTARLGLLRRRHLDGEFSLTEARILYEIGAHPLTTAAALEAILKLDAGYMSRLLAVLKRRRLIGQVASSRDGREKPLELTRSGEKAVWRLNERSETQLREMLSSVPAAGREELAASLRKALQILDTSSKPAIRVERLTTIGEAALAILEEYYEAVHVVRRDTNRGVQQLIGQPGSGMWLAYRGDEVVGCVVLRKLPSIAFASECKRLYVKPAARGNRIADRLLDAQEEFARTQGVRWIYLDTYDDLRTAIALYERRGYQRCERYNDNPQATLFMRKRIAQKIHAGSEIHRR
jgi:DNA-binding MarR family transcriptional regulator/GNAT superfamily N-acetyltransferase